MIMSGLHPVGIKFLRDGNGILYCEVRMPHSAKRELWEWERFIREIDIPGTMVSFFRGDKRLVETGVPCWIKKIIIGNTGKRQEHTEPERIDLGQRYHFIDLRSEYDEASCRRHGAIDVKTVFGLDKRWWMVPGELAHDFIYFAALRETDVITELDSLRCFLSDLITEYVGPTDSWNHLNRFCLERRGRIRLEINRALAEYRRAETTLAVRRERMAGLLRVHDTVDRKLATDGPEEIDLIVEEARVIVRESYGKK